MYVKTNSLKKWVLRSLAMAVVPFLLASCQKDVTTKAISDSNFNQGLSGLLGNWSLQKIKNVEQTSQGIILKNDSVSLDFETSEKLIIKKDYYTVSDVSARYAIEGNKDDISLKLFRQFDVTILKIKFLGESEMILQREDSSELNKNISYLYFNRF